MSDIIQNKTRKANQKLILNDNQVNDIKKCADQKDGYEFFMNNYCYVNCNGIIKYKPYDYQLKVLHALHEHDRVISIIGRQLGKCVQETINITIRNKHSGEIKTLTIGEFYEISKKDM